MIELACPHCGASQRLRPESAGERVACGACGKTFKVPLASGSFSSSGSAARGPESSESASAATRPSDSTSAPRISRPSAELEPRESGGFPEAAGAGATKPREALDLDLDLDNPFGDSSPATRTSQFAGQKSTKALISNPLGSASEPAAKSKPEVDLATSIGRPPLEPLRLDESVGSGGADESEIRVCCPVCESVTWVKAHKAGTRIACSDCGTSVEVPRSSTTSTKGTTPKTSSVSRWKEDDAKAQEVARAKAAENLGRIDPSLHVGVARKWGEAKPQEDAELETLDPVEKILRQRKLVDEPLHGARKSSDEGVKGEAGEGAAAPKQIGEWLREAGLVFATPAAIGAALFVGFAVILSEAATATVIWGAQQENAANLFSLLGWVVSFPIGLFWLFTSSVVGGTVVADTANGSKRVESWPPLEPIELMRAILPFLVPLIAALVPALLLTQMVINVGAPWWVVSWITPLVRWMLLPVFLLSSMRAGSPWHLLHRPTIELWKNSPATRTFYVLSAIVVFLAYLANAASLSLGMCVAVPAGALQGFLWVLNARLLGLLLRNLEEEAVS